MKFENPYWSESEKAALLERWILVHSYLYYENDTQVVSDNVFDSNCHQYLKIVSGLSGHQSQWSGTFKDFDGSTGFDLYSKLSKEQKVKIKKDAEMLLKGSKQNG